jgi:hypothetical protein
MRDLIHRGLDRRSVGDRFCFFPSNDFFKLNRKGFPLNISKLLLPPYFYCCSWLALISDNKKNGGNIIDTTI